MHRVRLAPPAHRHAPTPGPTKDSSHSHTPRATADQPRPATPTTPAARLWLERLSAAPERRPSSVSHRSDCPAIFCAPPLKRQRAPVREKLHRECAPQPASCAQYDSAIAPQARAASTPGYLPESENP